MQVVCACGIAADSPVAPHPVRGQPASMTSSRIGLALGSGSARGWAHIGVIEALAAAGIRPDIVCGCSIGALVGAAHAAGRLDTLRDWASALTLWDVVGMTDLRLANGGLVDGRRVTERLAGLGIDGRIEDLPLPFAAVATDLVNGRELWLRSGPVLEAVRASIAVPGLFSPIRQGDRWLLDGGLVNPVPVSLCRALGAEVVIAVNLNGDLLGRRLTPEAQAAKRSENSPRQALGRLLEQLPAPLRDQAAAIAPRLLDPGPDTPGYFEVLANSLNIMQDQITRTRLAEEPPEVLLTPRLRDINLFDYHRAPEAIAEGRACVARAHAALAHHARLAPKG